MYIYTKITASLPFIEVELNLTSKQMSMFISGLKYILPCQSRFSRKSIDDIITEQYQNISTIVKSCLKDNRILITDTHAKQAFPALQHSLHEFQSIKFSKKSRIHAQREYKTVQSIRRLLRQRPDVITCRVDKTKTFYVGNVVTIVAKAQDYMTNTNAYQEITSGRCPLADHLHAVQMLLNYLVNRKVLTKPQCKPLYPNLNKLELGHYHGLPKTHKDGIPLRPIIASIHAPATLISKFLNNLLAPIYLSVAHATTFINDIDVIRMLEKHVTDGYFTLTTKFVTADVTDLYTMIPRQGGLAALMRFLEKYSHKGKIGTLSINNIMQMARLILDTNCFAYNNKYYKQIRGGAMGSAFTQVFANIYMLEWEEKLIEYQAKHHEIYGRYIDDIFMTTNQTIEEEFNIELENAQNKDINIKIKPTIGTSVHFLDVTITNENGQLRTSIYHKPTAEPYILPYTSDHPRHIQRNIPYAALLRAARICSHIDDFNSERIRIDMSLLLNQYPPNFITKHFNHFFQVNNAMPVLQYLDEQMYQRLHNKLLYQPTRREKKLQKIKQDPVQFPQVLQTKIWDSNIMYPRYLFDSGLTIDLPKEFYSWWKKYYAFSGSPVEHVQIRLVTSTNRTLESFFIHKKPSREMLTKMEPLTS